MTLFLTVVHVMVCLFLIVVVLLQRGKGAEVGAVFGGGASSTVFGSRGAGNFLTKLTTAAAAIFMVTSLSLAYFAREGTEGTLFQEEPPAAEQEAPAPGETGETGGGASGAPAGGEAAAGDAGSADAGGADAGAETGGSAGGASLSPAPEEEPESGRRDAAP